MTGSCCPLMRLDHLPVPWRSGQAGFTLLELVVVMAVVAAALAVVAPNLGSAVARAELNAAVRDMASGLRYVRGRAMATGQPADFWLDVNNRLYRAGDRYKPRRLPDSVRLALVTADTQITAEGRGYIRFFPDGSSTGGRVMVEGAGQKRQLDVTWLTGQVRIVGGSDS